MSPTTKPTTNPPTLKQALLHEACRIILAHLSRLPFAFPYSTKHCSEVCGLLIMEQRCKDQDSRWRRDPEHDRVTAEVGKLPNPSQRVPLVRWRADLRSTDNSRLLGGGVHCTTNSAAFFVVAPWLRHQGVWPWLPCNARASLVQRSGFGDHLSKRFQGSQHWGECKHSAASVVKPRRQATDGRRPPGC